MIKVGTLFSGIGAPEQALMALNVPHKIEFACDFDPYVKETYLHNYPHCKQFFDDVTAIEELPSVDLMVYGFPCQTFSLAGHKNGTDDPRGRLLFKSLDLTEQAHPKFVVLENVYGFVTYNDGQLLRWTVNRLTRMGYHVSYAILNARNFGIPHNRERVFIVASDKPFKFPKPMNSCPPLKEFMSSSSDPSVYVSHKFLSKAKVKTKIGGWKNDYMPCLTHTLSRRGSSSEFIRDVAATFYATGELRSPTVEECRRLFGFSDSFSFPDGISKTRQLNMFTNSIVVPVIQSVVKELITKG